MMAASRCRTFLRGFARIDRDGRARCWAQGLVGEGWSGRGRRQRGRARAQNRRGGDKRSKRDVRTDVHTQAGQADG